MYDEELEEEPKSSFVTYLAEGNKLSNVGDYSKALESYNTALQIESANKVALVARAKCNLLAGDVYASLQDAEASLKDDKSFYKLSTSTLLMMIAEMLSKCTDTMKKYTLALVFLLKGLYRKAEALYQMGDFEQALLFYHRGYKLRPELQEFHLGIQKSKEAIDNSVGSPSSIKLEKKGNLSYFDELNEGKLKTRGQYKNVDGLTRSRINRTSNSKTTMTGQTTKTLLGEMYPEKKFLEKLLNDNNLVKESSNGMKIYDLVTSGISYLDTRTEFWRQQKPMYARKRDRMLLEEQWNRKQVHMLDQTSFILKNLDDIDSYLAEGKSSESLSLALSTLAAVNKLSDKEVPNKADLLGNLHSCVGNAYLELDRTQEALKHHEKDLEIAKTHNIQDARSRALDNLGRVHARSGNYQKAIDCWEEKLPLSKSDIENTWLFHEIGRCHLVLGSYEKAREFGKKSHVESIKAEDDVWQLNAGVLVAQAEEKLEMFEEAVKTFTRCLETAKSQGDETAEGAITTALQEVRKKMLSPQPTNDTEDKIDTTEVVNEDQVKVADKDQTQETTEVADED